MTSFALLLGLSVITAALLGFSGGLRVALVVFTVVAWIATGRVALEEFRSRRVRR